MTDATPPTNPPDPPSMDGYSPQMPGETPPPPPPPAAQKLPSIAWHRQGWFVVMMLVLFSPVGLFLMWVRKPGWGLRTNWIVTGAVATLVVGISIGSAASNKPASQSLSTASAPLAATPSPKAVTTLTTPTTASTVAPTAAPTPVPTPLPTPVPTPVPTPIPTAVPVPALLNNVIYVCSGNAPAGVGITWGTDSSNNDGGSRLPWQAATPVDAHAQYFFLSAQLQGGGSVNCTVTVNWGDALGQQQSVTKHASANGGYNIADAQICGDFQGGWQAC